MGKLHDDMIERIARVIDPLAWFHLDKKTDNRTSPGKRERSIRLAHAIFAAIPHLALAEEAEALLEEAKQSLQGVIALDDEDEGPDGESHSCALTAARISNLLAKMRQKTSRQALSEGEQNG